MSTTAPVTLDSIATLVAGEPGRQITLMAYTKGDGVRWDAMVTEGPVGDPIQGGGWDAATPAEALGAALAEIQARRGDA
jgi:hypothetical protein